MANPSSDCRVGTGQRCSCDECEAWDLKYDQAAEEEQEYTAWMAMEAENDEFIAAEGMRMDAESDIFEKLGCVLVLSNGEPTGMDDGWRLVKGQWEHVEKRAIDQWMLEELPF